MTLNDQDIRAKILEDLYNKKRQGGEIMTAPSEYARMLGVSEELANFNIQYLLNAGLVDGLSHGSMGTTKKWAYITDLTSFGIEAVEGKGIRGRELAVNFNLVNINAPVNQSQIAAGSGITQTQSASINTLEELERYLDQNFRGNPQLEELKSMLLELQRQHEAEAVKPSLVSKVKEIVSSLGPTAAIVMEFVLKHYLGIG